MADDLSTVASLLRDTNKKLDKLSKDNDASNTATSIIAQSLPEILSDRNIQSKSEKFDKKEGVTEVDEAVAETTKAVKEGNAGATKAAKDRAKAAEKSDVKQAKERVKARKAEDARQAEFGNHFDLESEKNRKEQKSHIKDLKTVNEDMGKGIEAQGGVAKANSEYVKGAFDIQMAEFALRKKNPELSRAGKSELSRENAKAKKEQRTTNGFIRRMASGFLTSLANAGKVAGMGIFGYLSVLGLAGFFYGISKFLGSKYWKITTKWIGKSFDSLKGIHKTLSEDWGPNFANIALTLGAVASIFGVGGILRGVFGKKGKIMRAIALISAALAGFAWLFSTPKNPDGSDREHTAGELAGKGAVAVGLTGAAALGVKKLLKKTPVKTPKTTKTPSGTQPRDARGRFASKTPAGKVMGAFTKFPRLGKFLGVLKGIPYLSSVFAINDLVNIFNDDKMSTKAKVAAGAGVFGGVGGSMLGASLGFMLPFPGGTALGVTAGYFGGDMIARGIMQYMLGEKVDIFPGWSGINDFINDSGAKKAAKASTAKPSGVAKASMPMKLFAHQQAERSLQGLGGWNQTLHRRDLPGTPTADQEPLIRADQETDAQFRARFYARSKARLAEKLKKNPNIYTPRPDAVDEELARARKRLETAPGVILANRYTPPGGEVNVRAGLGKLTEFIVNGENMLTPKVRAEYQALRVLHATAERLVEAAQASAAAADSNSKLKDVQVIPMGGGSIYNNLNGAGAYGGGSQLKGI
jgi:uncharacterized membrane protein